MIRKLAILKTGSKLDSMSDIEGDFEDWIQAGLHISREQMLVLDAQVQTVFPTPDLVKAVVITGSGAMVTEHSDWIEHCATWLRQCVVAEIPVLGICFGHQLLAYALGGIVDWNPCGLEVGSVSLSLHAAAQHDELFGHINQGCLVNASHRQSVISLPADAIRLGTTDKDANHVFRFGTRAWGIQFHPEFDARIIHKYIDHYADSLLEQGEQKEHIAAAAQDTPQAASVLQVFAKLPV